MFFNQNRIELRQIMWWTFTHYYVGMYYSLLSFPHRQFVMNIDGFICRF